MLSQWQIKAKVEKERRKREEQAETDFKSKMEIYRQDPFRYMVERLDVDPRSIDWLSNPGYEDHKWDGTVNPLKQVLDYLATGERRIGVESATGTGKTFLGAGIVYWFLECFENSLVVTTAPKQDQLTLHIWKEIQKMHSRFNRGQLTTLKLRMNQNREDWLAVGFVAGVKADEASSTKAQGFHAEHMLIILEETPGVPQPIITAFQNTSGAPHNIILAFGNPDHQLDNLHIFCSLDNTKHIRISAFDHPNVVLKDSSIVPGACSKEGLDDMLTRYGSRENPLYISRARGLSPGQSSDALIQMMWCVDARDANPDKGFNVEEIKKGEKALGVDVANSEAGDKAAFAYGEGGELKEVKDFPCPDSNQLGKRDVITKMNEESIDPDRIGVDGVGIGAGTVNALKEQDITVQNLIGSEKAIETEEAEQFKNLRSQMYWQIREDLRNRRIILPNDEELFADLVTPKWFIKNGKICIESKEDIKKRLGRSPNKGDAAVYWNWVRIPRDESEIEFLT